MDIANLKKTVDLTPGEWVDEIPDLPGVRLKVRSINYKPFKTATSGLARRSGKTLNTDDGLVAFAVSSGKPLAEHILVDWEGVKSNGKDVKFTPQTALEVLTADDDFGIGDTFRRAVEYAASRVAENLAKATKDAAKN